MDSKPTVAGGNGEGFTDSMNMGFGPNMFPGFNMPSLMGMQLRHESGFSKRIAR